VLGRSPINRKDRCRKFSWGARVRLFRRRVRCRTSVKLDSTGSALTQLSFVQPTILLNSPEQPDYAIGSIISERVLCARNTGRLEEP
jgi:hypothetical protein